MKCEFESEDCPNEAAFRIVLSGNYVRKGEFRMFCDRHTNLIRDINARNRSMMAAISRQPDERYTIARYPS